MCRPLFGYPNLYGQAIDSVRLPQSGRIGKNAPMSDPDLLRRFRNGDEDAIRQLYGQYARPVFTVVYSVLQDRELANDAVQQTFLKAWNGAHRFETDRRFEPWLYAIARRVAIDVWRKERRTPVPSEFAEPIIDRDATDGLWEAWHVRKAVDQLPDDEAAIVRLAHFEQLTHQEIAAKISVPVGTVKSRSHRAHRRLAELLAFLRDDENG